MKHGRPHGIPTTCGEGNLCSLLGYHCFLTKRIKEMRAGLGKNGSGKTKALVSLEKKLEKWLEQRSLAQILDWFDCVETTHVQTATCRLPWATTVGLPNQ